MTDHPDRVAFDADVCRVLGICPRQLRKLRAHGALPIPELTRLDRRHRYSWAALEQWASGRLAPHVPTVARRRTAVQ